MKQLSKRKIRNKTVSILFLVISQAARVRPPLIPEGPWKKLGFVSRTNSKFLSFTDLFCCRSEREIDSVSPVSIHTKLKL